MGVVGRSVLALYIKGKKDSIHDNMAISPIFVSLITESHRALNYYVTYYTLMRVNIYSTKKILPSPFIKLRLKILYTWQVHYLKPCMLHLVVPSWFQYKIKDSNKNNVQSGVWFNVSFPKRFSVLLGAFNYDCISHHWCKFKQHQRSYQCNFDKL